MKNIANIIMLLPLLIYVVLLLINNNLLVEKSEVNLFWISSFEIPIISIITLFFIIYILIIYFSGKFSSFFINSKLNTLQKEKLELKSKLADQIPDIESKIDNKYTKILEEFKNISNKNLELHKNNTKQVLVNLDFEIKNIKEKLDK